MAQSRKNWELEVENERIVTLADAAAVTAYEGTLAATDEGTPYYQADTNTLNIWSGTAAITVSTGNIAGQFAGSATTFAALPTTIAATGEAVTTGDFAILSEDDGVNNKGVYRYDGANYVFEAQAGGSGVEVVADLAARTTYEGTLGAGDEGQLIYQQDTDALYTWDGAVSNLVGGGLAQKGVAPATITEQGIYTAEGTNAAVSLYAATGSQDRVMVSSTLAGVGTVIGVQAGEELSGVTDGTYTTQSDGELLLFVDNEVGKWTVQVVGASTQTTLQSGSSTTIVTGSTSSTTPVNVATVRLRADGKYLLEAQTGWRTSSAGNAHYFQIGDDSGNEIDNSLVNGNGLTSNQRNTLSISGEYDGTAGETVHLQMYVSGGNIITVDNTRLIYRQLPSTESVLAGMVTPTDLIRGRMELTLGAMATNSFGVTNYQDLTFNTGTNNDALVAMALNKVKYAQGGIATDITGWIDANEATQVVDGVNTTMSFTLPAFTGTRWFDIKIANPQWDALDANDRPCPVIAVNGLAIELFENGNTAASGSDSFGEHFETSIELSGGDMVQFCFQVEGGDQESWGIGDLTQTLTSRISTDGGDVVIGYFQIEEQVQSTVVNPGDVPVEDTSVEGLYNDLTAATFGIYEFRMNQTNQQFEMRVNTGTQVITGFSTYHTNNAEGTSNRNTTLTTTWTTVWDDNTLNMIQVGDYERIVWNDGTDNYEFRGILGISYDNNFIEIKKLGQKSVVNTEDVAVNDQTASGYMDIGTMRIQWGTGTANNIHTFPQSFADTSYGITTTAYSGGNGQLTHLSAKTTTGFTSIGMDVNAVFQNHSFSYMAIGLKP